MRNNLPVRSSRASCTPHPPLKAAGIGRHREAYAAVDEFYEPRDRRTSPLRVEVRIEFIVSGGRTRCSTTSRCARVQSSDGARIGGSGCAGRALRHHNLRTELEPDNVSTESRAAARPPNYHFRAPRTRIFPPPLHRSRYSGIFAEVSDRSCARITCKRSPIFDVDNKGNPPCRIFVSFGVSGIIRK